MKKYLLIYFRNLRKEKTKLLNIFSLGITLAFALLILFFVENELSYDKWNKNIDNIYRISTIKEWPAKEFKKATSTFTTGTVLKNDFPEIESYARFLKIRNPKVVTGNKEFLEDKFFFTDSTFFDLFPYNLIEGTTKEALLNPNSIVISTELSKKYFNDLNPIGKLVSVNGISYTITGIIDNSPKSHFSFNALVSMLPHTPSHELQEPDFNSKIITSWGEENTYTYILTNKNTSKETLNSKLLSYYKQFTDKENGYSYNISLQPLSDTHFSNNKLENDFPTMNRKYVYIFIVLLIIILLFSILNYINLVVGNSLKTGKFIGLNKLFGMRNKQIFTYFISDSFLNAFIAIIIGLVVLLFIIPQFNEIFNKNLSLNIFTNKNILKNIVTLLLIIGIIPGIFLSCLFTPQKPFLLIRNQLIKRNIFIRKFFVFTEVSMLVLVVFGIILVNFQLYTLKNKDLGFNNENILVIRMQEPDLIKKSELLKNEIKKNSEVLQVSLSDASVGDDYWLTTFRAEIENQMETFDLKRIIVDENFMDLYGFEIIDGRNFNKESRTDVNNCIINEAVLKKLNLGSNPINKRIKLSGREEGVIIGVVKNFYFGSKHNEIEPLIICLSQDAGYTPIISVKHRAGSSQHLIQDLNRVWNNFSSNSSFNYAFVNDKISCFYQSEEKLNIAFKWSTILSFLIVSFGLICFVLFIIGQRTKEIGIRKVNGASTYSIVKNILQKEFLTPGIVALLIVLPICHFLIKSFIHNMVTEITISWWFYVLTIFIILITLLLTTLYQLHRAANKNPIETLYCE